jgi:Family of unknown function (DUF5677)
VAEDTKITRAKFKQSVDNFDAAVCEAIAVSQETAGLYPAINIVFSTYIFTQMCGAGVSMIRAVPMTRWTRSDSEDWRFGAIGGHARSIVDGYLMFRYLIAAEKSEGEIEARINVMHLNDCTRRIKIMKGVREDVAGFEQQNAELRERLNKNPYFNSLPNKLRNDCLLGKFPMLSSRDELIAELGFDKGVFDSLYDLWSQHIHMLPLSFYRIEANGRGTGMENDTDCQYMWQALEICSGILIEATDYMVITFPDSAAVRKGVKSKFNPGPFANKRGKVQRPQSAPSPAPKSSEIAEAMKKAPWY